MKVQNQKMATLVAKTYVKILTKKIAPQGVWVDFKRTVPSFARTNTPRKQWSEQQRRRFLSTGKTYTLPNYKEMKGHFVLIHDWQVDCRVDGHWRKYTIPEMQSTDFASIPQILHSLISPLSNSVYAAVLHDYLYRNPLDPVASSTTRAEADRIFFVGMKACGVSWTLAMIMYLGVRIGGASSYKRLF